MSANANYSWPPRDKQPAHETYLFSRVAEKDSHLLDVARGLGAYRVLQDSLAKLKPEEVTGLVKDSGLRGCGAALGLAVSDVSR